MRRSLVALLVVGLGVVAWRATIVPTPEAERPADVTVFGPWLGADADAFVESVDRSGSPAVVRYTGTGDLERDLRRRVERGVDLPDLAVVPQAGLVADLAEAGRLVPFSEEVTASIVGSRARPAASLDRDGRARALPYRTTVKSLLWYRPEVFAEHGWSPPATLDELHSLVAEIQATDGIAPWCFGTFSGSASGWPATDWIEDLVLRRLGPEAYDEWASGARPFDDPGVRAAFEELAELVLEGDRVAGGRSAVLDRELAQVAAGLFADDGGCALLKQADFAATWFPDGTTVGPDGDVDVVALPGVDEGAAPLVQGGDVIVQLTARADLDPLLAFLAAPEGAAAWAERGGFVSDRDDVDPATSYAAGSQPIVELLVADRTRRPDASEGFHATFRDVYHAGLVDWIAGTITLDDLLPLLDEARATAG